jgi:hypothetical protein
MYAGRERSKPQVERALKRVFGGPRNSPQRNDAQMHILMLMRDSLVTYGTSGG